VEEITFGEAKKLFPAPVPRPYQFGAIKEICEALQSGRRVILLEAPTGFGKSVVNTVFARFYRSFYCTPQLSLIDQIRADRHIGRYYLEIKGRENYRCTHDPNATCDVGLCVRSDFRCNRWVDCPYWSQKLKCLNHPRVLMSFAYFLLEGQMPDNPYKFKARPLAVLDEAHSIDRYVVDHAGTRVTPDMLSEYLRRMLYRLPEGLVPPGRARYFIELVASRLAETLKVMKQCTLEGEITLGEARVMRRYADCLRALKHFLETCDVVQWLCEVKWGTAPGGKRYKYLEVTPVFARFLAGEYLWPRAERFIISSATILDPELFIRENGLDLSFRKDEILMLRVPSTFPPENRPVYDISIWKLTKRLRKETLPKALGALKEVVEYEWRADSRRNIAVHCHTYEIAREAAKFLRAHFGAEKVISHESADRDDAVKRFKKERGKVFVSVAFEEGQDWIGDICEAQVLMKVPYPDLSDRRVWFRVEKMKHWRWFYIEALKKVIQAYGRAVRSPEDKANFWVIDYSFKNLIKRCKVHLPGWFREAIIGLTE